MPQVFQNGLSILIIGASLLSCDASLISEKERNAIVSKACAELRAAEHHPLQRLRIVNTARESLGREIFLGEDKDIQRYLHWGTCEQFVADEDNYLSETNRRDHAFSLIKRNAESEGGRIFEEYFTADLYLIRAGNENRALVVDTATMSTYSGAFEGLYRQTDEDGEVEQYRTQRTYSGGELTGQIRDWHMNGQLAAIRTFEDGEVQGLTRFWYENGQLEQRCTAIDSKCEGIGNLWYENGQLWHEGNYIDHKLEGMARWWHENGEIKTQETYVNGEKHGLSQHWDQDGNLDREEHYLHGNLQ